MSTSLRSTILAMLVLLGGCSSSGHDFDQGSLSLLTPGGTTLAEASRILQGPPDQVYWQGDGSALALWRFHVSFLTDGLYGRKQALLRFGSDGRFVGLADSTNIVLDDWERRKLQGEAPAR